MGTEANQPLTLPDGGQPLPLGSGYIAALLGGGAMSNVYKIWNPQLETFRAVKLMKPDLSTDSRQRFQTEMKIMAALSHPNIIEIHSVGEWNGLSYIEMEFVEGFTLSEIIEKKGALPIPACTSLCIMIARALVYAHNKDYVLFGKPYHGIIHRDIKPSNLMVTKDGKVKLMDFGIARPVETSLMTMDGAVMGTMQYLAPEQIDGKNVGVTADIYALGAVFYEILTGQKAFPQKNLSQLMAAKTGNSFVPLKAFNIKIPQGMKRLVSKCMTHDSKSRIPSAQAMLKELEVAHRRLTLDNPEAVMRSFLSSPIQEKNVLTVRKPLPVRAAAIVASALIAAALVAALLIPSGVGSKKVSAPAIPSATAPVSRVTEAPAPDDSRQGGAAPGAQRQMRPPSTKAAAKTAAAPGAAVRKENADSPVSLEVFEREVESGNFEKALQLYGRLPAPVVQQKNAQLLRLRALYGLGRTAEVGEALDARTIDDGEYYLIKAKFLIRRGDCSQSLAILEKSMTVRAQFLDADVVRRDYLYCHAQCLSRRYDEAPSPENRKVALDAWFEVKNAVRRLPRHMYYTEAVSEMQRIGEVSRPPENVQAKKEAAP
jgi:eukaryotic-like serine/threonine-protein kinase